MKASLLVLILGGPAWAQGAPQAPPPPVAAPGPQAAPQAAPAHEAVHAQERLEQAAQGQTDAAMDGSLPRREGPYLIVEEEKDVLVDRYWRTQRHCYPDPVDLGDGIHHGHMHRTCEYGPSRLVKVYGTRQTVEVGWRQQLEDEKIRTGAAIGAGVGAGVGLAVALILLATSGIGALAVLAFAASGAALGAGIGALAGYLVAENTPDRFERFVDTREVES